MKKIEQEDLVDSKTEGYYQQAYDLALVYPMLEMASDHIKYIPEIVYLYLDQT